MKNMAAAWMNVVGAALVLGLLPVGELRAETNAIESIAATSQGGGRVVLQVKLKHALQNAPAGFALLNPPRIALDFPGTVNATGRNAREISEGDLRRVNIAEAGERTRLVLELARPLTYDTQIDGRTVLVTLMGAPDMQAQGGAAAPAVTQRFAEAGTPRLHALRDIDFRRGAAGEGRIVVDLSDDRTGIDVRTQGRTLTVNFANTTLPDNLARRMDVSDFGTPVRAIESSSQGGNAQLVIEPQGNWEHSAYQTNNRFVIEVKRVAEDPNRVVRPGYVGEKLSLNFQNVEVRAVLQVIADFTGLNIITSDTVSGNLTLRLRDVPWDQALDIVLQSKGLDKRKTGNVVWIAPRDELATREKLALETQAQIAELEPTRTETFQLNYQRAIDFAKLLTDDKQRLLSRRGSAVIDARTNTIFVQDTPGRLEEVGKLVRKIDIPVRQVMIESRIVEAIDTFSRNLGIRLGVSGVGSQSLSGTGTRYMTGGSLQSVGAQSGQSTDTTSFVPDSLNVNLPAASIGGAQAGVFSLVLFNNAATRFLNLELSALQADGRGKVISSPRVITADQVEALIEQGTEIPYQQATSSGATAVQFKKATLSLKVKPQITPDDNVIMSLNVHKDSVGVQTISGPSIDTKQVTTEVLVENGGTVVIGGIYTQDERTTITKVPGLGDLPYVGFLFTNSSKSDNRNELLVFVTPRILKDTLRAAPQ
ncbi:MAG TPA: type IV pilus secretin PilQ family protein [Burkholderiales bacterium]|nr:type IV pilus secretin PilQ family protein [Burkholderiales bacterium]